MRIKLLVVTGMLLGIASLTFWAEALPHRALRDLYSAAGLSDVARVERLVDTDAVRAAYADEVHRTLIGSVEFVKMERDSRMSAVALRLAKNAAAAAGDAVVEGNSLRLLMEDGVDTGMAPYGGRWSSANSFTALFSRSAGDVRFDLSRSGLTWRVVRISHP